LEVSSDRRWRPRPSMSW